MVESANTMGTNEVAKLACVDMRSVRYWVSKKGLPAHYEGHQLRFYEKDVLEFLTKRKISTAGRKKHVLPKNMVRIEQPALTFFAYDSKPCEMCKKPLLIHNWVHMNEEGDITQCSNVTEE